MILGKTWDCSHFSRNPPRGISDVLSQSGLSGLSFDTPISSLIFLPSAFALSVLSFFLFSSFFFFLNGPLS